MQFTSRRSPVLARRGMVATSQPLAAMAGLKMLMEGGNAVDAAVATAAALAVVEPMSTGIGGDAFALIWMDREKQVRALNGSGRAPAAASLDEVRRQGYATIPNESPYAVSVPGTVDAWQTTLDSYGTMSLADVLKPAIAFAEEGYAVSPVVAYQWGESFDRLARRPSGHELLLGGRAPRAGEVMRLPELGRVLRDIADGGPDAFYHGPLAERIASFVQSEGGWLATEDLASHFSTWDEPISTDYRGVTVWECPPNGQGLVALLAMNIMEGYDVAGMGFQSPETYHHMVEAIRLGFADGLRYIADPAAVSVPTSELLSKSYAAERRGLIRPDRAMPSVSFGRVPAYHDTVYITCADGDGNACSFINSLFQGFGTGLVVPGTGIALQNRAALFSLDAEHPNALAPGVTPLPHDHPGHGDAGRRALAVLRRDGGLPAAAGAPAGAGQHAGLRAGPAGGPERAALQRGAGRHGGAGGGGIDGRGAGAGAPGPCGRRRQRLPEDRVRRGAGHRAGRRYGRAARRVGAPQGRHRRGVVVRCVAAHGSTGSPRTATGSPRTWAGSP